jgi:hypothetical protein
MAQSWLRRTFLRDRRKKRGKSEMRDQTQPKRRRPRLLLIAAAVLLAMAPALIAGNPAYATTDIFGPLCGTGASSGNVTTCITVNGSGLHVDSMTASATVNNSGRNIQVCIHGPSGTFGCNPGLHSYVFVSPGGFISHSVFPNANEPAGQYCANTFRLNDDGTNTMIGHQCGNVHA